LAAVRKLLFMSDENDTNVTAIDILLEPDQTMIGRAREANAALRASFPAGFALDATHHPHVSIFAGFVPTRDLPEVYAAAAQVLEMEKYTTWKLTAFRYYYVPLGPMGLAGIVIEPTDDLIRLQQELIDAVGPLTVKSATAAAFYTTPAEPNIEQAVIDYIAAFDKLTGKNFSPHVTIGLAERTFLDPLLAQPFDKFTFSPTASAVYQFGNYGTARNKLKAL
jgi:hypothetical protein